MRKKLNRNQENALLNDYNSRNYSQNELATIYDISQSTVSKIINSSTANNEVIPNMVFNNCNFNFGEVNYNNQAKQNDDNYKWKQIQEYEQQFDKDGYLFIECGDE